MIKIQRLLKLFLKHKYDVDIAKNYLNEKELKSLNRIVTMYLDYAESQT